VTSVWLPKSRAIVCLAPGAVLTEAEVADLDEYFVTLAALRSESGHEAVEDALPPVDFADRGDGR
jgi:hypothetical protein